MIKDKDNFVSTRTQPYKSPALILSLKLKLEEESKANHETGFQPERKLRQESSIKICLSRELYLHVQFYIQLLQVKANKLHRQTDPARLRPKSKI
jgi:hypothetical protein